MFVRDLKVVLCVKSEKNDDSDNDVIVWLLANEDCLWPLKMAS